MWLRSVALGVVSALSATAQMVPGRSQDFCVFDGPRLVVISRGSPVEAKIESPQGMHSLTFPPHLKKVDYFQGRFWGTHWTIDPQLGRVFKVYSSGDGKAWEEEGWGKLSQDNRSPVHSVHPLGSDRFLLVAWSAFEKDKEASPLALGRRLPDGEIRVEEIFDLKLREPFLKPAAPGAPSVAFGLDRIQPRYKPFWTMGHNFIARYPGGILVPSAPGWLWAVDIREGTPKLRPMRLFSSLTEEVLAEGKPLEQGILGCQPMPDGTVLLATRSEAAVRYGRLSSQNPKLVRPGPGATPPLPIQGEGSERADSLEIYPELLWWKVDPDTGSIHPLDPPRNLPGRIQDVAMLRAFRFRPKTNGDLLAFYN